MEVGRDLAERCHALGKLLPILDFVPGNVSPPPAPKHTTAASNKPKVPKPANLKKPSKPRTADDNIWADSIGNKKSRVTGQNRLDQPHDISSPQPIDNESGENTTMISSSPLDGSESFQATPYPQQSRKRKRKEESKVDNDHQLYSDSLLDYFIITGKAGKTNAHVPPPIPDHFEVNRPIDNQNHTALHWAASMGDLEMVRFFLEQGADRYSRNIRGETPLIRAVVFTNNFEKSTLPTMAKILHELLIDSDSFGGTIFHHAAALTLSDTKRKAARYYLDVLISTFSEVRSHEELLEFLTAQDQNGDTALHIVARNRAKKCIRALQGVGAASNIENHLGETADSILGNWLGYRTGLYPMESSSPVQPDSGMTNGYEATNGYTPVRTLPPSSRYAAQSAVSFSDSFANMLPDQSLKLSLAMENGMQDKHESLTDANRLFEHADYDHEQIRKEKALLLDQNIDGLNGSSDDDRLAEKEAQARTAAESRLEQIQHKTLHQRVRAQEQSLPPSAHHQDLTKSTSTSEAADHPAEITRKYRAALALADAQIRRRNNVASVVQAQATAGMSEKGETYKRLIGSTMGVPAQEIPILANELLEVVESAKSDYEGGASLLENGIAV